MVYCAWCANGARHAAPRYPGVVTRTRPWSHGVVGHGSQILGGSRVAGRRSATPRDPANADRRQGLRFDSEHRLDRDSKRLRRTTASVWPVRSSESVLGAPVQRCVRLGEVPSHAQRAFYRNKPGSQDPELRNSSGVSATKPEVWTLIDSECESCGLVPERRMPFFRRDRSPRRGGP